MIEVNEFKAWLKENTNYSDAVVGDMTSRVKRADHILEWSGDETYFFYLSEQPEYKALSISVRSQLKKSVKLYMEYYGKLHELTGKKIKSI